MKMICVLGVVLVATLVGCSTAGTRVIANDDGTYQVTGSGLTQDGARNNALDSAQQYCTGQGKQFYRLSNSTQQHQAGGGTRAVAGVAGTVVGNAAPGATKGYVDSNTASSAIHNGAEALSSNDYELHFRCK